MPEVIDCQKAEKALSAHKYEISSIQAIAEGSNHYVFDIKLSDSRDAICKFTKIRDTESNLDTAHRDCTVHKDTLFGGALSLEREAYLFGMIRQQANVPTPRVYGIHQSPYGKFIVLEKLKGMSHKECMEKGGYSKSLFLKSLAFLGEDFAKIQKVTFQSFGNIMDRGEIEPAHMDNFSDRFKSVLTMRLERCRQKGVFTDQAEDRRITHFFLNTLEKLHPLMYTRRVKPALVFTDMHAENFFTDKTGRPTGYFDLESAQAAPPALEFYGFRFFLFNFYDKKCFHEGEDAFWKGYCKQSDGTIPIDCRDSQIVDFLAGCRILELMQSYWGYIDGIRDSWGQRMKALLFLYMETGEIDYMEIGEIWRMRDKHPSHPLID